jgi:methionine aminopeptidase
MAVTIHTAEDIAQMRVACRLASEVLDYITPFVKPGATTGKLNELCHAYMRDVQGTVPAPLNYAPPGYPPFPASICTSVNDVICHGIPGDKVLKNGDIVNLDITVITKEGYYGDTSRTFIVGEGSILAKRLTQVTFECMWKGIAAVRPGARLGDIGHVIQQHAEFHLPAAHQGGQRQPREPAGAAGRHPALLQAHKQHPRTNGGQHHARGGDGHRQGIGQLPLREGIGQHGGQQCPHAGQQHGEGGEVGEHGG